MLRRASTVMALRSSRASIMQQSSANRNFDYLFLRCEDNRNFRNVKTLLWSFFEKPESIIFSEIIE